MSLFRCANCGSPNVLEDVQNAGVSFDYKKAIVGTVVLGAGGAVAGMSNNTEKVYKCPDCGMTLTYPMLDDVKQMIDYGLHSVEARSKLSLNGVPISWDFLKTKYKNIGEGLADTIIKNRTDLARESVAMWADLTIQKEKEKSAELELAKAEYPMLEEKQKAWEDANKGLFNKIQAEKERVRQSVKSKYNNLRAVQTIQNTNQQNMLENKKTTNRTEKSALEKKLLTLGFFAFGEKKNVSKRMEYLDQELIGIEQSIKDLTASFSEKRMKLDEEEKNALKMEVKKIDSKYTIPPSPVDINKRLERYKDYFYSSTGGTPMAMANREASRLLYSAIEVMGGDFIIEKEKFAMLCEKLLGWNSTQKLSALLRQMKVAGIISLDNGNRDSWHIVIL